jgi:hypothetical protein
MEIKFKDLKAELGLKHFDLLAIRKEKLKAGEDYVVRRGICFFSEAGADKVRLAVAVPLAVPKKATGMVIRAAPNPRWVYVKIDDGKKLGSLVPVAIPRRLYGRLIGKRICVDIIQDAQGGTSYRHELLGG